MSLPVLPVRAGRSEGTLRLAGADGRAQVGAPRTEIWAIPEGPRLDLVDPARPPAGVIFCGDPPASGAAAGPWPAIAGVDADLFREGEHVTIDGGDGTLEIEGVHEVPVVTAFLQRTDGKVLLLRRSDRVGSFRGRWAAVSGFLEDPTPLAQALREVREETGLGEDQVTVAEAGRPVLARDSERVYVVHPFRFRVGAPRVELDWEHTEFEWIDPDEIGERETVPKLAEAWARVRSSERAKP